MRGVADARWLAGTIETRERAIEGAAPESRPRQVLLLARALCWSGADARAASVLVAERRTQRKAGSSPAVAFCELALSEIALLCDDEERATAHLELASGAPASERAVVATWLQARRRDAHVSLDVAGCDAELAEEVALELSWSFEGAVPTMEPHNERSRALFDVLEATRSSDPARLRAALDCLEQLGLLRDLGRASLRVLAVRPELLADPTEGGLSAQIRRAPSSLGDGATWRDRGALRHAWRVHGRRDADKALPREVAVRLDARDGSRARVHSMLAIELNRNARALDDLEVALGNGQGAMEALSLVRSTGERVEEGTKAALDDLGRTDSHLAELVASTFAERERARSIAATLATLEASTDVDGLLQALLRVIMEQIEASAVVIAERSPGSEMTALTMRGIEPHDLRWRDRAERALSTAARTTPAHSDRRGRSDAPVAGPVMAVPMRAAGVDGVVYVDKLRSGGAFTTGDQAALEILASHAALSLARLRATQASAALGRRLSATIDQMRDGLIALDASGVVTALNEPGARALRVDGARLLGRRLDSLSELAPLAAALAQPERLDGLVVRLPQSVVVVHAREIAGEGLVATLMEYERAQRLAQRIVGSRARYTFADLRGNDPGLCAAIEMGRRAAVVDASVLIVGESGTGKELMAQAIHTAGPRAREPFVAINCAALPRELLEAELFGYERGAFTGARGEGMVGKFELAGEGTILLDEIVDLPLDMQAKLLRVLQERVVVRLGSAVERPVNARVLATGRRDLGIDVERGAFRLDLLHRLRVLQIVLPPLRERPADILVLAYHFLRSIAERQRKKVREMTPEVETALEQYAWPGNVRELSNVIEAEVSLLRDDQLLLDRVPPSLSPRRADALLGIPESIRPISASMPPAAASILPLSEVERRAYLDAYEKCGRSVSKAARALGVSRATFYGKLKLFGMHPAETTGEHSAFRGLPGAVDEEPPSSQLEVLPPSKGPKSS